MAQYRFADLSVLATPEEIVKTFEDVFKKDDFLGERVSVLSYLSYSHVTPYLKEGATEADWQQSGDEDLRKEFVHYRDWWREKVEDERGISCHRGKEQFLIRMFLAGLPEWREIWDMDGGWYQISAYNRSAELFEDMEPIIP